MDKHDLFIKLKGSGFSEQTINAFTIINREDFIPESHKAFAYEDSALPIGKGSTISQPYTIALMLDLLELKKGQKILEIGSGSGYVLALLENITKGEIYGIEINKPIAKQSQKILKNNPNITIYDSNGSNGLPEKSPFNRILISASCDKSPDHILSQLTEEGILVASVKNSIVKIKRTNDKTTIESYDGFVFVPLVK